MFYVECHIKPKQSKKTHYTACLQYINNKTNFSNKIWAKSLCYWETSQKNSFMRRFINQETFDLWKAFVDITITNAFDQLFNYFLNLQYYISSFKTILFDQFQNWKTLYFTLNPVNDHWSNFLWIGCIHAKLVELKNSWGFFRHLGENLGENLGEKIKHLLREVGLSQ